MGARIDLETRTAIVKAIRKGDRRSAIARKFNVSQAAVARIGRAAGIVPLPLTAGQKHSQRMATQAIKLETRRRRTELSNAFIGDVEKLRQQLFSPALTFGFDARGVYHEHQLKEPDARGKRDLAIAMAILVDKHVALERLENESEAGIAKAAIIQLIDHLEATYEADQTATKVVVAT
jgi:hypothetical protein